MSLLNARILSINTISPFTAYQRRLVIPTYMGREGRGHNHQNTGYRIVRFLSVTSASLLYHSRYGNSTVRHLASYEYCTT